MTKLAAVIQVPFRSANQFLGEGGLQVREYFSAWIHHTKRLCDCVTVRMCIMASATKLVSSRISTLTSAVQSTVL